LSRLRKIVREIVDIVRFPEIGDEVFAEVENVLDFEVG
jgi:hypothetical protein